MKRFLALILFAVMTMSIFVGCGQKENKSSKGNNKKQAQGTKEKEDVTLRFVFPGSSDAEKQWAADFKKDIEEKYPNVTIEWMHIPGSDLLKKITVMVQAGDVPDVIAAQDITDFVKMDALEPLDGYVEKDDVINIEDFNKGALEFSKVDGKTYTLPTLAVGYGLLVNTKVLNKAGFKLEDLKTWDDYLAAAKAMTKDGQYALGFCGSVPRYTFREFYIAAASNGIMYDELTDPKNKKPFIELMNFYKQMKPYITPAAPSVEWGDVHRYMVDGKIGFLGTGTYFSGYMGGFAPECLEYLRPIPHPAGPSVDKASSLIGNLGFGMFKDSKNKELAWKIIREALSEKFAAQLAGSINTTALNNISEETMKKEVGKYYSEHLDAQMDILSKWNKMLNDGGVPQPKISGQPEIERAYQEKFFMMLDGTITPEQMYDQFIEEVKSIQEQY